MLRWLLLTLVACPPSEPEDTGFADADDDGYDVRADCDDNDASVNPGASESCNGIDDDCDELVDDDDDDTTGQSAFYADADGDGYGDLEQSGLVYACEAPSGTSASDDDCDDASGEVYPGAPEEDCTDPTDYNCDGSVMYDDADEDGLAACEDCDDADADVTLGDTYYADEDGDGYGDEDTTTTACSLPSGYVEDSQDCDDADYDTNPGVEEECEDGIDNDCDGLTDDADLAYWYEDGDGDGYGDPTGGRIQCDAPSGYVGNDEDCDDEDEDVNPGESETWYDGVDADCDGSDDYDQDGDGYTSALYDEDGEDCDDEDASISPDASETLDGADEDCDDVVDELAVEDVASVQLTGSGSTGFGTRVDVGGDLDGDGVSDLLGSTSSRHYLFSGPVTADATVSDAVAITGSGTTTLSSAVFAGDVDGDGYEDLLTTNPYGSSYQGAAYLVLGPITGSVSYTSDADAELTGDSAQDWFGYAAAASDLNADGYSDLVISELGAGSAYRGSVHVFLGPITADLDSSDADVTSSSSATYEYLGYDLDIAGDLDGDGLDDVVAGARLSSEGASYGGAAYALYGPLTAWPDDISDADVVAYGSTVYGYAGSAVAGGGDVDGDGYGEFLVGAPTLNTAYVVGGGITGSLSLDNALAVLSGASGNAQLGTSLAAGDFNGDGDSDVAVGAPYAGSTYDGAVYLFSGAVSGSLDVDTDASSFTGSNEFLGISMDMHDLDDDGFDDLVIGASANDDNGANTGAIWVLTGRSW